MNNSMSLTSQKARSLGRLELLAWVNGLVGSDYATIPELRDGVAFVKICQILQPKRNIVSRLAGTDNSCSFSDYERNFALLESTLRSFGVQNRPIDAKRLAKGSFRDLHELLQWMHSYVKKQAPKMSEVPPKVDYESHISANIFSSDGAYSSAPPLHPANRVKEDSQFNHRFVESMEQLHLQESRIGREAVENEQPVQSESSSAIQEAKFVYQELEVIIPALELDLTRQLREQQSLQGTLEEICRQRDGLFDTLRAVERVCELLDSGDDSAIANKASSILRAID